MIISNIKSLIGIVVIGRNEGKRLSKSLLSCMEYKESIIYVDSGSTDNSIQIANTLGINIIELDKLVPFTAARARNEGVTQLIKYHPHIQYVQFIDGDCEISIKWLSLAVKALDTNKNTAIVCGRLRERFPNASIYNRICDIEWNGPLGEITSCGGIFMMRLDIFMKLDGFNASLIAGEEPELCSRVRRYGKKIIRLDNDMAWHDAAMKHFSQWWKRAVRSGYVCAERIAMHGDSSESYEIKESLSIWFWSTFLPVSIFCMSYFYNMWCLLLIFLYPYKVWSISHWASTRILNIQDRQLYALNCIIAKWPEAIGQIKYWLNRLLGRTAVIIEHK